MGRNVSRWGATLGLVLLAVAGATLIVAGLKLLAGARAYVHGEGRWSKAQQEVVFYLDRFAETGHPDELARARQALRVPLGDMDARKAMEAPDLDAERARQGLFEGENHPGDVPKMIWMFRYFTDAPYVRDAVAVWRETDEHILALAELADQLEREWAAGAQDLGTVAAIRGDLRRIDRTLRALETRFSESLSEGMRLLETAVAALSVIVLLVLALAAIVLFRWATRRVRASERMFWESFEHAPLGMALLTEGGAVQEVNDTFCAIMDRSRTELLGTRIAELLHAEGRAEGEASLGALPESEEDTTVVEASFARPDGSSVWGRLSVSGFPVNERGTRFIAVLEDVSSAKALAEELAYEARHDPLTGLVNRRSFERELDAALAEAHEKGTRHTLVFVDLDRFKRINDTCGHGAGDEVLQEVARLMGDHLRTSDVLARLGGDEFGIILRRCPIERGTEILDQVRGALTRYCFDSNGETFTVASSMGVVEIHERTPDAASVLGAADRACYRAKAQGGDRVEERGSVESVRPPPG